MHTLTSGRSTIMKEYIDILSTDFSTLFFGKGFSYHTRFFGAITHGAHNTYLDFILAWGIAGTVFLYGILKLWFNAYKRKVKAVEGYTIISKFPMVMLLLNFADLSCFSAGMFFIVITVALVQLRPIKPRRIKYKKADKKNVTKITKKNSVIKRYDKTKRKRSSHLSENSQKVTRK